MNALNLQILKRLALCGFTLVALSACATQKSDAQFFDKLKNEAEKALGGGGLTQDDAAKGITAALERGVETAVEFCKKPGGYLETPEIKIPLPQDAQKVEKKLRQIGLGNQVDDAITSINKAAELAAAEAAPIFVEAIRAMTIEDALSLVSGNDSAATSYLRRTTNQKLTAAFTPVIEAALEKTDATKYWNTLFSSYNKIPFVERVNPNLVEYATAKAIDGLFTMIKKEELNIRENPSARVSEILKKVFG